MLKQGSTLGMLLTLAAYAGPVCSDTITLKDGTVREGTIVEQDENGLTLEIRIGGLKGAVKIQRQEIARVQRQALPPDVSETEAAKLRAEAEAMKGGDAQKAAEAWMKLGAFYAGRTGFSNQAQAAYEKAIEAQPDHAEARRRLGHVKTKDGWRAVEDEQRAKGLVPLDDLWVKPADRALLIDRRHEEQAEDLRIAPRKEDPFTKADMEKLLKIRALEEEVRTRERLRLAHGESLLSRYGYYENDGLDYIGPGGTPHYASGVELNAGDSHFFAGTVGSGFYPARRYSPGFISGDFGFGTYFDSGYRRGWGSGFGFSLSGGSRNFRYNFSSGFGGRSSWSGSTGWGTFGF